MALIAHRTQNIPLHTGKQLNPCQETVLLLPGSAAALGHNPPCSSDVFEEVGKIPGQGKEVGELHPGRLLSSYHSATKSVGSWLSSRQKYKYALISLGPSGSCMIGG